MLHRTRSAVLVTCLLALPAAASPGLDPNFASFAPYAAVNPHDPAGQSCVAWEDLGPRLVQAADPHCAMHGDDGSCRDVAYEGRFTNVCPVPMEVTWKWQDHYGSASLWTLAPGESRAVSCLKLQDGCSGRLEYRWSSR